MPFAKAPYPPLRGPPSPRGGGKEEAASPSFLEDGILALSEQIHAYVEKEYRRTQPSPRGEGDERSEPDRVLAVLKRGGNASQVDDKREHPIHR